MLLPVKGSPDGIDTVARGICFYQWSVGTAAAEMIFERPERSSWQYLLWSQHSVVTTVWFYPAQGSIMRWQRKFIFKKPVIFNKKECLVTQFMLQSIWPPLLCLSARMVTTGLYSIYNPDFYFVTILGIFILRQKYLTQNGLYKSIWISIDPGYVSGIRFTNVFKSFNPQDQYQPGRFSDRCFRSHCILLLEKKKSNQGQFLILLHAQSLIYS